MYSHRSEILASCSTTLPNGDPIPLARTETPYLSRGRAVHALVARVCARRHQLQLFISRVGDGLLGREVNALGLGRRRRRRRLLWSKPPRVLQCRLLGCPKVPRCVCLPFSLICTLYLPPLRCTPL